MSRLLTFPSKTHAAQANFSQSFLAIQLLKKNSAISSDVWHSLSPQVMRWQADIFLIDLHSCASYWQSQAQAQQLARESFLEHRLDALLGEASYLAVLSQDPWQAVLLLSCLRQKNLSGVIARSSQMGENLWPSLDWDDWWKACRLYAEHSGDKQVQAELSKRQIAMQLAMQRLGCSRPAALKCMPTAQIHRRFGALIGKLWAMTWSAPVSSSSQSLRTWSKLDFPWQDQPYQKPLSRQRILDNPLRNWDDIETFLREDLNHFCFLSSFKKGERILAMEWKLVLYNLQEVSIPVLFRHPHSLHQDLPNQRTALLQIFYALEKKIKEQRIQDKEGPCFWISSWELHLTQKIQAAPRPQLLFADAIEHPLKELLSLENQLPKNLEAYAVNDDWVAEDSFCPSTQESIHAPLNEASKSLAQLGQNRPLYLQRRPYPLPRAHQSLLWKFKERIMEKWWLKPRPGSTRDYYAVLCDEQVLWVSRNQNGDCTVRGIYG